MEKTVYKTFGIIALCLVITLNAMPQSMLPPLERPVSLDLNNAGIVEMLKVMEVSGYYTFAYETGLINTNLQLSRRYINKTTRDVLDDVFQGSVVYKEKGNYIILRQPPKLKSTEVCLEGYIYDYVAGNKIPFASIYDTVSLTAGISDNYGRYNLCLTSGSNIQLTIRKSGYADTSFTWTGSGHNILNIPLTPELQDLASSTDISERDSLLKRIFFYKPGNIQSVHLNNLKNGLNERTQISIVPFIGTHGTLSSNTVFDYSINIFGGVTGGVRKAEVAGLFNLVWDSVQHLQVAGLFNAVGGEQKGVQVAGICNLNNRSFLGLQIAGCSNFVRKDFGGIQTAGYTNLTWGSMYGVQASGFFNYAGDTSVAIQVAGFANYGRNNSSNIQVAGFANAALNDFTGIQVAGFSNHLSGRSNAIQVSGFLNTAKHINGSQFGFINVSDSISGVPVGFLSFSRHGLHQFEVSGNEVMPLQLLFRTGNHRFYNTLSFAVKPYSMSNLYWGYGYGLGSAIKLNKRMNLYMDLQAMQLQHNTYNYLLNLHNKFSLTCEYRILPGLAVALGPSFNVAVSESVNEVNTINDALIPYHFSDVSYANDIRIKMWTGGSIALRFF